MRLTIASKIRFTLALAAWASFGVKAMDTFDPATGRLSIDSVSVNGTVYRGVVATLNAYALLGIPGGTPVADTFDPASNVLTLGAVSVQGVTYNNVRVRLDSYALTDRTYSDCVSNTALTTPGNNWEVSYLQSDQVATLTTSRVNGTSTFNGNSAVEIQSAINILSGPAAGSVLNNKSYLQATQTTLFNYGGIVTATLPLFGTVTNTNTYSPAIQTPLDLPLNAPYTQSYAIQVTPAIGADSLVTQATTFLGMESITVPAGLFTTCKISTSLTLKSSNPSLVGTVARTDWHVASGPYRGLIVKTADDTKGIQSVATKLLINGI